METQIRHILRNIVNYVVFNAEKSIMQNEEEIVELPVPEKPPVEVVDVSSSSSGSSSSCEESSSDENSNEAEVSDSSDECSVTEVVESQAHKSDTSKSKPPEKVSSVGIQANNLHTTAEAPLDAFYIVCKTNYLYNVYQSIKYDIWCSTYAGNKALESVFTQRLDGPIYLFLVYKDQYLYGIAEMTGSIDHSKKGCNIWIQDLRSDGYFLGLASVKFIAYLKIEMPSLRKYGISKDIGFFTRLNYRNGMSLFTTIKKMTESQSGSILDYFGSELKKTADENGQCNEEKAVQIFVDNLKNHAKQFALHRDVCLRENKCLEFPLCASMNRDVVNKQLKRPIKIDTDHNSRTVPVKIAKLTGDRIRSNNDNAPSLPPNSVAADSNHSRKSKQEEAKSALARYMEGVENENQDTRQEIESLKKALETEKLKSNKEIKEANGKIEVLETTLEKVNIEKLDLKQKNKALQNEVDCEKKRVSVLENNAKAKIEVLETKLEKVNIEKLDLNQKNESLQNELDCEKKRSSALESNVALKNTEMLAKEKLLEKASLHLANAIKVINIDNQSDNLN